MVRLKGLRRQDDFITFLNEDCDGIGYADELRDIFTSVPYRDIQEVINETRSQSKRRDRFR